eukprot:209664-Hanusia_phi.AAC.3
MQKLVASPCVRPEVPEHAGGDGGAANQVFTAADMDEQGAGGGMDGEEERTMERLGGARRQDRSSMGGSGKGVFEGIRRQGGRGEEDKENGRNADEEGGQGKKRGKRERGKEGREQKRTCEVSGHLSWPYRGERIQSQLQLHAAENNNHARLPYAIAPI